jgi:hypothetical protein
VDFIIDIAELIFDIRQTVMLAVCQSGDGMSKFEIAVARKAVSRRFYAPRAAASPVSNFAQTPLCRCA